MLTEVESFLKDPEKGLIATPRAGQIAMGTRVAQTMASKGVTFVEAPVGTGKSFAYLVPAVFSPGRTVVATAKKSLQDQLVDVDIPAVKKATGKQFSFTVLKGAGNYFCQARMQGLKNRTAKAEIAAWQASFLDIASNGDVATFPGGWPAYWSEVNVDECDGQKCAFFSQCGYAKVITAAQEAHIVVTNHHVVAHQLLRRSGIFGDYRNLIIDEAHQFPEALRSAQTKELSLGVLNNLHRRYESVGGSIKSARLEQAWDAVAADLSGVDGVFPHEFVSQSLPQLQTLLTDMAADIKTVAAAQRKNDGFDEARDSTRFKSFHGTLLKVDAAVTSLTQSHPDSISSIATEDNKSGTRTITVQPLNPGGAVSGAIREVPVVVVTSGTLAINGTFNHVAYNSGLAPPSVEGSNATSLICASPFNYGKQAVLYTPKHLPKPVSGRGEERVRWVNSVSIEIKRLIEASDGNALVLFSSMSDLTDIHRELLSLGVRHPIIAQKAGRAAEAEAEYRATDNAVLLGSKSFFEGLNIVGDKLWSVIIPRLPFPVPSDPVIATKTQRLEAQHQSRGLAPGAAKVMAFQAVSVPPMLFDVLQGGGRLIRTVTDRGVLSILDPRIWTGSGSRLPKPEQAEYSGYGATLVEALKFPRRTAKFENVSQYFKTLRK